MIFLRRIAFVLFCVGIFGCDDRHSNRAITNDDLAGTWQMTPASLALLTRDGVVLAAGQRTTITFAPGGSMVFDSIVPEFKGGNHVTITGTWELKHNDSVDNETKRANSLKINASRWETWGVAHKNGKIILWTYYGDPDQCEFIDYVKK